VKKSQLDYELALKKMKETVASGLPQINSTVSYMDNLNIATVLIPNFFEGKFDEMIPVQFGTQHNATVGFQIQQLVFSGSYFVGLQTSKIFKTLAEQGLEQTQLNTKETVTSTYYIILVSEESERILQSSLANLEKTHFEIKEMLKEGFVEETDADLVQIGVTKLKNSIQNIRRQTEVAHKLLKFQMGLDLEEKIALTESLEDILKRVDVLSTVETEFDLNKNIDYQLLTSQEKLMEMALKNEKVKYLPTVSAFYSYQQNAMRNSFNFFSSEERWYNTQIFGVNIMIPLFTSGVQKAKVQQARLTLDQAKNSRQQAAQGLILQASQAKINLTAAYENYLSVKETMGLSQKVYNVTLVKYKEGVSSSMDLTQAHDEYLMSQSEYIKAISDLLNAKNTFDKINNYL
jgi:outer membrane protein TolC